MRIPMRNLWYALRVLRRNKGLALAVIATLTLGIGATTAIYTVVYATLLAPLPYPEPGQLVMVWSKVGGDRNVISAGDFPVSYTHLDVYKRQSENSDQLSVTSGQFSDQPDLRSADLDLCPDPYGHFVRIPAPSIFWPGTMPVSQNAN